MSDTDRIAYDHVDGCVKAYLRGKKSLNWVMSYIKGHHLPANTLAEIINNHAAEATGARLDDLRASCQREGFLPGKDPNDK